MTGQSTSTTPSSTGSGPVSRSVGRGLDEAFRNSLKTGLLQPILRLVMTDPTLSLNIRNNYITIYHLGGILLKIVKCSGGYHFEFDANYMSAPLFNQFASSRLIRSALPLFVSHPDQVVAWLRQIPYLKMAIALYSEKKEARERSLQQMVERANNHNYATDYFIIDIEYQYEGKDRQRCDLVALHWPSTRVQRRGNGTKRLAIIEIKYRDNALCGSSGLESHIHKLDQLIKSGSFLNDLAEEMHVLFDQRVDLGLIERHSKKDKIPRSLDEGEIVKDGLDYILLLADHDPDTTALKRELATLSTAPPGFEVYVATASFMGFGLFDERIYPLKEFLKRFPDYDCTGHIAAPTGVAITADPETDLEDLEDAADIGEYQLPRPEQEGV